MTRYQCEKKIGDLIIQIDKAYHEYNPDGMYLYIAIDEKQLDVYHVIKRNGKKSINTLQK